MRGSAHLKTLLAVGLLVLLAAPAVLAETVAFDLPFGDRAFPAGPNVALVSSNCAACHSAGMILNQPRLTKAVWEAEVNKMINVYKAPIDKADVAAIVAYLAAVKGPE